MLDLRYHRLDLLTGVTRTHGELAVFCVGDTHIAIIGSPQLAAQALVDQASAFEKPHVIRTLLGPGLGNGFLLSDNDTNRKERKLVVPAFHHRHLPQYASVIAEYTDAQQRHWRDGQVIDIAEQMMQLTLTIVGKLLFSAEVMNDAAELRRAVTFGLRHVNAKLSALVPIPYSWPTIGNIRFRTALRRLDLVIARIIEERRKSTEPHIDLLELLIDESKSKGSWMTDAQLRDEIVNLLLAGHETTASALTWTWYLLSKHPHVYERVRAETFAVLGHRAPKYADLAQLPYTLQVFKEAMRLYPPAYVIGRQATDDVVIGGRRLPKGTIVVISAYAMHRHPEHFPDPERFDPDRFAVGAEDALPKFAYMPFSGGPRMCLGPHLALTEAHVVLAILAQKVELRLMEPQRVIPEPLISLRPKYGLKMTVRRMQKQ